MAKRKTTSARPVKRVLAQQEVVRSGKPAAAHAHRSAASQSDSEGGFARDILALVLFLAAIGVLTALLSYHREDGGAADVQNLVGPVGHRIGHSFFGLLGLCAYLAPVALFYTSMALFVRGRGHRRWRQIIGLLMVALSGSILAHLLVGAPRSWAYPPGGAMGAALGETLRALFSTFGSGLVAAGIAAAGLVLATDSGFARLCVAAGRLVHRGAVAGSCFALEQGRRQIAEMRERHAQRMLEKAEEEAAFAQALADAEDMDGEQLGMAPEQAEEGALDAAGDEAEDEAGESEEEPGDGDPTDEELCADEADAVAEEAARLAREAEHRSARIEAEAKAREAAARAAKRARRDPIADPAWALSEPPAPAAAVAAAPEASKPSAEAVKEAAEAAAAAKPVLALPEKVAASLPPQPAAALPAPHTPSDAKAEPAGEVGPVLPLIVEPKAPPRPKAKDEKKDPFAFEGASNFSLPPITLLEEYESQKQEIDKDAFFSTAEKLREKLASFGIHGQVKEIRPGPVVTMYEFEPAPGIKISKIASLADDLAMAMEALKVRIVAPIPGKGVVGIEVPNKKREMVHLREIVEQDAFLKSTSKIAMAIGKNIEGMPYVADLAKMPHLLIAGTTGSGKSVSVNAMIMSMLFKATPEEVRFIMVDPKVTELSIYEGIPHLLLPVVTDARKAALALRWAVEEMERRYQLLAEAGVRNIAGYNKWIERMGDSAPVPEKPAPKESAAPRKLRIIDVAEGESEEDAIERAQSDGPMLGVAAPTDNAPEPALVTIDAEHAEGEAALQAAAPAVDEALAAEAEKPEKPKKLPFIVIIIDEVADLMMVASREVETYVARLAQMARAAGIHLMIATQRPSTDVITGVIKANFPSRISFQLRSKPDSMTILGTVGAEALLGMGDMLILPPTSAHLERVHGAYVSDNEISKVVAHLRAQGKPVYDESILKPRDEDSEDGGGGGNDEYADEAYDQCLAIVAEMHTISVSMLQRKLRLGYNRAARIIERMEREGIVGPANGSKPREVLIRPVGEMHKEANL